MVAHANCIISIIYLLNVLMYRVVLYCGEELSRWNPTRYLRTSNVPLNEVAWAVKPLPAVMTGMFPRLVVVKVLRIYRTRSFRRKRSVPGI